MTETLVRPQAPWALRLVPPFPAVANRVMSLVAQEDVGLEEVGELIKMDPSFAAELLRFANSPLFGVRREVRSVVHAVIMLGVERVRTMATLVAVNRMIRSSVRIQALRKVWIHSLATARITEEIARFTRVAREGAYTFGLLHNLGTLGLMSAYPDEYSRMLDISDDFGFDLLATERDLFEIDHCAAGAFLAQDWGFPDEMASVIATHHEAPYPNERSLTNFMRVAWRMADTLGYAAFSPDRLWSFEELLEFLPNVGSSWLGVSPDVARATIDTSLAGLPV
jgi:putative nucleotidyltransferase with HDIG domain